MDKQNELWTRQVPRCCELAPDKGLDSRAVWSWVHFRQALTPPPLTPPPACCSGSGAPPRHRPQGGAAPLPPDAGGRDGGPRAGRAPRGGFQKMPTPRTSAGRAASLSPTGSMGKELLFII
eukprot:gene17914-biopygen6870